MSVPGGGNLGSVRAGVEVTSNLKGIETAARGFTDLEKKTKTLDQSLNQFSITAGLAGGAIAAALGSAARSFVSFENQMLAVKAVTGTTGAEFDKLNEKALQIGKDTKFSATEGAAALEELAKAGVSVDNILGGAADGAVALAAAAGIGIPQAAVLISNALNQFSLAGNEAGRVADIFANVSNKSAADATDFGEALSYVGTQASTLKVPIEEIAAAIAVLADQGIKGSSAGTALNMMMSQIVAPTKKAKGILENLGITVKDAQGNFVGITSIIEQFDKALDGLGNAERQEILNQVFGEQGGRAVNALLLTQTEELQNAGKGWDDYKVAMDESGTAAKNAETRMSGIGGALESLGGSIETAKIEFGEKLAPAIKAAAVAITGVVNAFGSLPDSLQTIVVGSAAAAAGFLLLGAAAAQMYSTGKSTIKTFQNMAEAMKGANVSARGLATGLGITAAVVAAGFAMDRIISEANEAREGFDSLKESAKSLTDVMNDFKLDDNPFASFDAQAIQGALDKTIAVFAEAKAAAREGESVDFLGVDVPTLTAYGDLLPWVTGNVEELGKQSQAASDKVDEIVQILQDPQIDTEALATAVLAVTDAFDVDKDPVKLIQGLQSVIDNKAKYGKQTKETTQAINDEVAAQQKSIDELNAEEAAREDAADAAEKYSKQISEIIVNSLIEQGALQDISPELDGLQEGYGKAGQSAEALVLAMNSASAVSLSQSNREALQFAESLSSVEKGLEHVEADLANNQSDFGMWAERIRTTTDVLGGNTEELNKWIEALQSGEITQDEFNAAIAGGAIGGFEKLDALYASGAISLDQYNQAKAAGVFLIQRSAGGLQDESAEMVQNIIDLAHYVKMHDTAAGAVDNLTEAQRAFLAATKSPITQEFLQTLALLKSIGADPEVVQKFIIDSAVADDVIAAYVEDLGLIEGDHKVDLTWENSNQVLDDINGAATVLVSMDNKHVEVFVDTEAEALEFAKRNADELDGKDVTFYLKGDRTQLDIDVDNAVTDAEGETVEIPVKAKVEEALNPFASPAVGQVDLPDPPPVAITAEDQTSDGVDDAKETLGEVPDAAGTAGEDASQAFADGLDTRKAAVSAAVQTLLDQMNLGFQASVSASAAWGGAAAANFASAFVNALAGWANSAYNAGFNVAYNAKIGADAALGIHSPSRVAMDIAENFGGTFIDSLVGQGSDAARAGSAMMNQLTTAMGSESAFKSLFGSQGVAGQTVAQGRTVVSTPSGGVNLSVTNYVSGVSDPEAASDMVVDKLYTVFSRLDAGGATGR